MLLLPKLQQLNTLEHFDFLICKNETHVFVKQICFSYVSIVANRFHPFLVLIISCFVSIKDKSFKNINKYDTLLLFLDSYTSLNHKNIDLNRQSSTTIVF